MIRGWIDFKMTETMKRAQKNNYWRTQSVLLLLLVTFQATHTFGQKGNPEQPNIIFIMADDLGYGDIGVYGQSILKTPNIDRLATGGMRFTQAYAGGSVCTPSRSVFMTGLHGGHTVARDNVPHYDTYLEEEHVTLAQVLKSTGYATGGVGKWSLGDAGTVGRATNKGFDMWLGYLNQDHAHYYYPDYLDYNDTILGLPGNTLLRDHYSHDVLTNGALNFIRSSADQPFFLYVAYTVPHYAAPEEDEHGLTVPSTAAFDGNQWPTSAKKYATMLDKLDADVGRITDLIQALDLAENTLIVFTSDNGGHSTTYKPFNTNGPLRGYKRDLTEGGIRVPFIAYWPGHIPDGVVNEEVIAFQDMLPTFAALAGAKAPENCDGISVVNALLGNAQEEHHEQLYWEYGHCRARFDQAVRLGNWKGIRLGKDSRIALYDLSNDVSESLNVAEKNPDVVRQIARIMNAEHVPNERYPVGERYDGSAIWQNESPFSMDKRKGN